ncbi:MAG: hypothetical protein H6752_05285 [Candidatus Omnitrophica bacterium]|nr:hypothetical protein [Candidatus Omnitrophota bacterium]
MRYLIIFAPVAVLIHSRKSVDVRDAPEWPRGCFIGTFIFFQILAILLAGFFLLNDVFSFTGRFETALHQISPSSKREVMIVSRYRYGLVDPGFPECRCYLKENRWFPFVWKDIGTSPRGTRCVFYWNEEETAFSIWKDGGAKFAYDLAHDRRLDHQKRDLIPGPRRSS